MNPFRWMKLRRWDAWLRLHRLPKMAREVDKLRSENKALLRWVRNRHLLSFPSEPVKAALKKGVRLLPAVILSTACTASGQAILRTFYTTNTTPVVTASIAAMDTVTSNGLVNFTLTASNGVRLVAGLDATNHANAILQSSTNYANGTTNSSIVRQVELTAASNALVNFTLTASNNVRLVAGLDATNHANAILQSATNYANGVTNSSIVRQADLTTASNVLNSAIVAATNSASVTNWINSRQPATATLTNLSATGAITNLNDNQFSDEGTIASIKDGALLTNITLRGTTTVLGAQTNSSSLNVAGGVTNWSQQEVKGTLNASSNLLVKSGQSASNAFVGGTYWWSTTAFTNHTATGNLTNLATNIIAAHVLTNNGDTVHVQWRVKMANLLANTNQFQIIYGSQTVLDTGLLPSSNSVCTADLWITRTGDTAQHAEGRFEWGPGSGAPFAFTNTNVELVQTNGIATIFQLRHAARRVFAVSNNWTRVYYDPAVR